MSTLTTMWKRLAVTAVVLGVVVGCGTVVQTINDQTGGTGFSNVDNGFTGDSPGTGDIVGDEDVELPAEATQSFFTAFQIDPVEEDTAGPKFAVAGDVDQDGLLDLVSGWNQSQPIQLHLQRRDPAGKISFRTVTIAGTSPTAVMAGVRLGQIDNDGWLDIVVLVKAAGGQTFCPPERRPCTTDADCNPACALDPDCVIAVQCGNIVPGVCDNLDDPSPINLLEGEILVYFSPGNAALIPDGDRWQEMTLINPFVDDTWIHHQFPGRDDVDFNEAQTRPELSGFTDLEVVDIDQDGMDDILVALNPAECKELGQEPPTNTVDLWMNPGGDMGRVPQLWGAPPPAGLSRNVPLVLMSSASAVKDIAVDDVDGDGDPDVIATFTNALTLNISWRRNPAIPHTEGGPSGRDEIVRGTSDGFRFYANGWESGVRPVGQVDTNADILTIGDVDNDGFNDVIVRSSLGRIIQWFRRPNSQVVAPEFPPADPVPNRFNFPWPVFTLTEFNGLEPQALSAGDITGDGQIEVLTAVGGGVFWFDGTAGDSVFDPWASNPIIQNDGGDAGGTTDSQPAPGGTGVGVEQVDVSTHINALLVVDLDGDGKNDIVGTLDRRSGAGLSDDRLVWYRNVRTDDAGQ